jgi:S-adenosylmethionine:tRNA ribosyltransferase-isomerase
MTTTFVLDPALSATEPPEARGIARDGVRLLVAEDGRPLRHALFRDLPSLLCPGDLVVVNTSDTEPAAVDGVRSGGRPVTLHISGPAPSTVNGTSTAGDALNVPFIPARYVVELRDAGHRVGDGRAGERVALLGGATASLVAAHPDASVAAGSRLWLAEIEAPGGMRAWLRAAGRPIRYSYVRGHWPIAAYRTDVAVPSREFASAEMPSAGRPLTRAVLAGLAAAGVGVATVALHTGVSSLEAGELPLPERYRVPAATAAAVNAARAAGGRVVAVGTTVTRALESAARDGVVTAADGWTDLVLSPDRPARVVTGLVTGWHEPEASHLLLLEAVAGAALVDRAYAEALRTRYLWHEFGDSCLLLPGSAGRPVR